MRVPLALAALLAPLAAGAQPGPSFDCAAAATLAAQAICADPALAELDVEQVRVFHAIEATVEGDAREALRADEAAWIAARDACPADALATCLRDGYAERIHDLMLIAPAADDGGDASRGPYLFACPGFDEPLSAVFVNVSAPLVTLRWGGESVVLPQAVSASGARYAVDGVAEFWTRGDTAMFTPPGGAQVDCARSPAG